jgi:hypothetical protein
MTPRQSSSSAGHTSPDDKALGPRAEQWPGVLDEYDVRFLVLDSDRDAELLELFQAHPGWVIDSQDDQAVLLVRTDVRPGAASSRSRG